MFKSALQIQKLSSALYGVILMMGLLTFSNVSNAQTVCANRTVTNTKGSCGTLGDYGFYADDLVTNVHEGALYSISNTSFVEYTDGTANFTAHATSNNDSDVRWDINISFSGRTTTPPAGSPKSDVCHNAGNDYYYYTATTGTLKGRNKVEGAQLSLTREGEAFQVGTGANMKDANLFGASGWLKYNVTRQPNNSSYSLRNGVQMDINIRLSGGPTACTANPPAGCNATVSVDGSKITVNNIGGTHSEVNFLNSNWQSQQTCSSWGANACGNMTMYTAPSNGTYYVLVKTYDASWNVICNETETVTVNGGLAGCTVNGGTLTGGPFNFCIDGTPDNIPANGLALTGVSGTQSDWIVIDGRGTIVEIPSTITATDFNAAGVGTCFIYYIAYENDVNGLAVGNNLGALSGCFDLSNRIDVIREICNTVDCPALGLNIGDSCNDGNANTSNDIVQSNCSCAGTPTGGGGCNASVVVDGNKITVNNLGGTYKEVNFLNANWQSQQTCSSWGSNPCGSMTMYTAPAAGTYYVLIKTYSSSWSVICNETETVTVGGTPPPPPGVCSVSASVSNIQCNNRGTATQSDDTFTFRVTATITNGGAWGYDVEGTNIVSATNGSTKTINGGAISGGSRTYKVFNHDDPNCFTNITVTPPAPCSSGTPTFDCPALNANIGDSCDDGNANTTNDQVQSNCTCAGTPVAGGTCNATITATGNKVTVSGVTGTYQQVIVADASWNTVFSCDSWGGTACGSMPMFTATTAGNYNVTVKSYTSGWSTICNLFETVTLTGGNTGGCDNVTNGGQINGAQSNCGSYDPSVMGNAQSPSGGSGTIEYIWLRSTSGCPTSVNQAISGATGVTYNPGTISQTTWYRRCSRRAGCTSWFEGESNCIKKEVKSCGATVCATRTVMNSVANCGTTQGYGFFAQDWIYGAGGLNNAYDFQNGSFVEYTDGTARLTGTAINLSNSNVQLAVDVTFSGRTNSGAGKANATCGIQPQNDWYYYTSTTGTLTGQGALAGALVNLTRDGDPFQVGTGANLNDRWNFGASGWLNYTIVSQPNNSAIQIQGGNKQLDINIRLTGNAAPCAPFTSRQAANNNLDVAVKYDQVELAWTNDTGYKNDLFEIERSKDGNNWESIGAVETLSLDDTPKFYRSNDSNPYEGFNYYRVKVTYIDGSVDFTETKRVTIADVEDFGIFPNPAQETVNVSLKGYEGKDIEIQVVNQFGSKVQSVRLNNVTDATHQLELNTVQNGIYSLWIFTDGRRPVSKKMIVNKMY